MGRDTSEFDQKKIRYFGLHSKLLNSQKIIAQKKIFVLRNNDLGDVLVTTPLLAGLRISYPNCHIAIGVGDWAKPLLEHNPHLNELISCNAPWHNKQNCSFPANSPRTFLRGLSYILFSQQANILKKKRFTHGIDVLGSRQGAWLMLRTGIKSRFGVKGYAGGDRWCEQFVNFDENRHVAKAATAFLPLLGADQTVESRPQIFLTNKEKEDARRLWGAKSSTCKRIVIAPGGGFPEKCWGNERFTELTRLLLQEEKYQICILGSQEDRDRIKTHSSFDSKRIQNFCGSLDLRKSAALVSEADFVFTNSSLCMHLAGAFQIPSITLLGECYDSAKLHEKQWGYIEGDILGKETIIGKNRTASVNEAHACFVNLLHN